MAAARPAGLNGVVEQVVSQPLEVTVAHEGILGQMAESRRDRETGREGGRPFREGRSRGHTLLDYNDVDACVYLERRGKPCSPIGVIF